MHIKTVTIKGLRLFEQIEWELPDGKLSGWHVIIGDNGAGKSTFLRAIALALCGPKEIQPLREDWERWCKRGSNLTSVRLYVNNDEKWDKWAGSGKRLTHYYPTCGIAISKGSDGAFSPRILKQQNPASRHIWSRKPGWFSAAYGPFRRFSGGDPEQRKLYFSHATLSRHLTVFGENTALTEALEWLTQLRFEELDGSSNSGQLLSSIRKFINQPGFLPHSVSFKEVTSKGVYFINPEGFEIEVNRLSDGFRSILSLTFELIRQMVACYKTGRIFDEYDSGDAVCIKVPGVVLIDEVDAHLHPSWQRKIGPWLTAHFPNIQFIVTTHSPLVCQAAEKGSIFRLPSPGSNQQGGGFVTGKERERLIYGDVLDAYGTALFGENVDRSDVAKKRMEELAVLNQKALLGPLNAKEDKKREVLAEAFAAHPEK